jgi:hypothetical protein
LQLTTLGERVDKIRLAMERSRRAPPVAQADRAAVPARPVSDILASEDFLSRMAGMTQSETSVAWCDENAIIGFNDSGSFMATLFGAASPSGSLSFNGWSRSTDRGRTFMDQGPLLPDPLPPGVAFRDLFGDPVLGCTDTGTFYYASLALDTIAPPGSFISGISVSKTINAGLNWSGAVMAASKPAPGPTSPTGHMLDKPWMAVSPGPSAAPGDDVIHVTYTDFDSSGTSPACPLPGFRTAIEYVRSVDGGVTWSAPAVIDEVCGTPPLVPIVQGSQVEVGLENDVYVAWERYAPDSVTREIRLRKSTTGGTTFEPPVVVSALTPVGDGFLLQGGFRAFLDLQGLAVDRSAGPHRGTVYIAWHDGRNLKTPDPFSVCPGPTGPAYCFADVLLSRSTNGGATWSPPIRVNTDATTLAVDQFMPAIEVDSDGTLVAVFYDRRKDLRNFLIDVFSARSTDGGFAPVLGLEDRLVNPVYMGDYIGIATDATQRRRGSILTWGDNSLGDPNIEFTKKPQ